MLIFPSDVPDHPSCIARLQSGSSGSRLQSTSCECGAGRLDLHGALQHPPVMAYKQRACNMSPPCNSFSCNSLHRFSTNDSALLRAWQGCDWLAAALACTLGHFRF